MASPRVIRRRVAPADGNGVPQTFDGDVAASSDDARQDTTNGMSLVGISIVVDATTEHCGLRWLNVTIPSGATIDVAQMGVYIRSATQDEPKHQIRGQLDANPGTFTSTSNNIDSRSRTTASTQWNSSNLGASADELWEWGAVTAGAGNGTNLKDIVQEIVDQGGWASGNALVMIYEQHTSSDSGRDLEIRTYDHDPGEAAALHIEYTA